MYWTNAEELRCAFSTIAEVNDPQASSAVKRKDWIAPWAKQWMKEKIKNDSVTQLSVILKYYALDERCCKRSGFEGLTKDFVVNHSQWVTCIAKEKGTTDQLERKAKKEGESLAQKNGERKRR